MLRQRPSHAIAWPAAAGTALVVLLLCVAYADTAGQTAEPLLSVLAPMMERLISLGGLLTESGGRIVGRARLPALLILLAWLGAHLWRCPAARTTGQLAAALSIGWIGQSYLLDRYVAAGTGLYGVAAAAYLWRGGQHTIRIGRLSPLVESSCLVTLFAAFLVAALYHLDVYPAIYVDERAYMIAARMQVGDLPPASVYPGGYSLERFQFQFVPLALQSLGVAAFSPGILALRLTSVVVGGVALLAALLGLRRRIDGRAALLMIAFAVASPLFLTYARAGLYFVVSTFHGVLSVVALAYHHERRSRSSACLLGILLGLSPFCYQLSWFVPVLLLGVFILCPELRRPASGRSLNLVVAASAMLVILPGVLLLSDGLRNVANQTFDSRALWHPPADEARDRWLTYVAVPQSAGGSALLAGLRERGLARHLGRVQKLHSDVFILDGSAEEVATAVSDLEARGAIVWDDPTRRTLVRRFAQTLARLFYTPHWESNGRMVAGPVLNPLVSPLLVIGLAGALRRRSPLIMRILAIWVLGAALLPPLLGGFVPRRELLMLPFAYALAALPIIALLDSVPSSDRRCRWLVNLGLGCLLAAVAATGAYRYFECWHRLVTAVSVGERSGAVGVGERSQARPTGLWLSKAINGVPQDRRVLVMNFRRGLLRYLRTVDYEPALDRRVFVVHEARTPQQIRWVSCIQGRAFSWIAPATEEHEELFAVLASDFVTRGGSSGPFRVVHVDRARPGVCASAAAAQR